MLPQRLELPRKFIEPARLHPRACAAEGAGAVLALDAVDDEVCDGRALCAERVEVTRRLLEGHRLGDGDEDEARARRVEEHRAHRRDPRREVAQEEIDLVLPHTPPPREVRDHVTVLLRHHVERADPAREDIGQPQHPRRVPRRRRVHDDAREVARPLDLAQLEERHHLVHAREREVEQVVDVRLVEDGAAVGNLREDAAVSSLEVVERGDSVHLAREESRRVLTAAAVRDLGRAVTDFSVEAVREGVRGVGREEEEFFAGPRRVEQRERGRGRGRGLARAALAAEEEVARVWEVFGESCAPRRTRAGAAGLARVRDLLRGAAFCRQRLRPPAPDVQRPPPGS